MPKSTRSCVLLASRICLICSALAASFMTESGLAQDASCKAVLDSQSHQLSVPYHGHSTVTLVPGKSEPSEEISTGKALYIRQAGKWTLSRITPAEMRAQQEENIKTAKMVCHVVRDETVDGVSATLYSIHTESDGLASDSKIWISKSTGLPVWLKMDSLESHYVYTDVVAPVVP